MKTNPILALTMTAFLWHTSGASAADAHKSDVKAKITMNQAETAALKVYPGTVLKRELEKERGGSGLRYSFDIKNGNIVHEVGIDAVTGEVLENSVDTD